MLMGLQIRALRATGKDWVELDGHLTVVLCQIDEIKEKLSHVDVIAIDEVEIIKDGAWCKASITF